MYVISIGSQRAETRTTLAGVLEHLNRDRAGRAVPRVEEIALRHIERGAIPVLRLKSGAFAVRPVGTARSILTLILEEIDRYIVRTDGRILRPQDMSRSAWGAVMAAGRLAHFPEEAIDLSQGDAGPLFRTADLFEETGQFGIAEFVRSEFHRRFGYGINGPLYAPNASPNGRHEIHVAYALLRGEKLRECVVNAYRESAEVGANDVSWLQPLIHVPALRGALAPAQLQGLCDAMRHARLEITSTNAPRLVAIMRGLPGDCSYVQVDDALFEHGILPALAEPLRKQPEGEASRPVSGLAARMHHLITQRQFHATMDKAKADREALLISQRRFDDIARRAVHTRVSTSFDWPNEVALAVLQRDIAKLLKVFDNPKDWNADSKRALRDELDVDLLQCSAAVRRRRLFELCGFSADEQREWEHQALAEKAQRNAERDLVEACQRAEAASWRIETGQVMNGREYVDFCIAEGFSEIVDLPRGGAREYRLRDPRKGCSRRLRAKDGTLSYARARLAQIATPLALAA
ncbi:hypothetical protein [Cupriavidus numazuensis]|uniref:Uncharacterized protein n=1 Tax=Cupriavidus numazuensis TaxID=221992 RepID=A0ABM8TTH3_9BURK|nr:hypothetical protein [Cupriavidus numazuensis]CAG2159759.1 hypothetical protein LMG26411_06955 [Cupriavidus numazuensis]